MSQPYVVEVHCFSEDHKKNGEHAKHLERDDCEFPEPVTSCCGASQKGGEHGLICRYCYGPIDSSGASLLSPARQAAFKAKADQWRAEMRDKYGSGS
jgi:hypothetical protein